MKVEQRIIESPPDNRGFNTQIHIAKWSTCIEDRMIQIDVPYQMRIGSGEQVCLIVPIVIDCIEPTRILLLTRFETDSKDRMYVSVEGDMTNRDKQCRIWVKNRSGSELLFKGRSCVLVVVDATRPIE